MFLTLISKVRITNNSDRQKIARELRKAENDLKQRISQDIESEIETEIRALEVDLPPTEKPTHSIAPAVTNNTHDLLGGIIIVTLIAYALIIGSLFFCLTFGVLICTSRSVAGGLPPALFFAIADILAVTIISFLSKKPRDTLVWALLINLPIIMLAIFALFRYIGLVIIGLIILSGIIQGRRR